MTTAPATPSGILFFVHGANETSGGLSGHVARIEDQVRARGWDVTVVAPEWRRHSELRLGNWRAAVHRRGRPSPMPMPILKAGVRARRRDEDRHELLRGPARGAVRGHRAADARGRHRLSHASRLDPGGAEGRARACREGRQAAARSCPVALSLGGIALVDLLGEWPEAPVDACVTVGSQAPLLYTFDAIPSMPYDEADPPHLAVPWLNIYDTRDFLSFLAEPLFRRSDGLASVVDLRVHSGKDFPKSHSAYWELPAVWDAIATAFTWRRTEPLTVREARRQGSRHGRRRRHGSAAPSDGCAGRIRGSTQPVSSKANRLPAGRRRRRSRPTHRTWRPGPWTCNVTPPDSQRSRPSSSGSAGSPSSMR